MITFAIDIGESFLSGNVPDFKGLDTNLEDLFKDAMDQSAAAILNRLRTTFLAEQDPYENPWIPSGPSFARRKKGGTGTLFDTGRLFRSIQLSKLPDMSERGIYTDVSYAVKHQFGLEGMKVREILAFTPDHENTMTSIFQKKVEELCNV